LRIARSPLPPKNTRSKSGIAMMGRIGVSKMVL
jgi:hypothetical protein